MMSILQMSKLYCLRPSEVIGLYDEYEAFCFDEACAYIVGKIKDGLKPNFNVQQKEEKENKITKKKARMLPSEIYKKYE